MWKVRPGGDEGGEYKVRGIQLDYKVSKLFKKQTKKFSILLVGVLLSVLMPYLHKLLPGMTQWLVGAVSPLCSSSCTLTTWTLVHTIQNKNLVSL